MFSTLTEKIENVFKKLRGQAVLTEQNITDALKEVRLALLEADVNFKIVKDFKERPLKTFKTLKKTCKNGGNPDAGA